MSIPVSVISFLSIVPVRVSIGRVTPGISSAREIMVIIKTVVSVGVFILNNAFRRARIKSNRVVSFFDVI